MVWRLDWDAKSGFALRSIQQTPRVDRPPSTLCYATPGSLPATQGQRYADLKKQKLKYMGLDKKQLLWPGWHVATKALGEYLGIQALAEDVSEWHPCQIV